MALVATTSPRLATTVRGIITATATTPAVDPSPRTATHTTIPTMTAATTTATPTDRPITTTALEDPSTLLRTGNKQSYSQIDGEMNRKWVEGLDSCRNATP